MLAVLRRIEAELLRVPELAAPDGFEVRPISSGGHLPAGPDGLPLRHAIYRFHLGLEFYAPRRRVAGEGCTCVSIVVNDDPPPPKHRGEGGLPIYLQTDLSDQPVPGATEVWGELLDVPRERSFLDAVFVGAGEPEDGPLVLGYRLSGNPAPPAWHVRTPNYGFWRVRRSAVEVRSIRVHIGISGTGLKPRVQRALLQTFRRLDWAAFNRMLDEPR